MTEKLLAGRSIHGPTSPSGHCTLTWARSASPRPKWSQPSCPPAWPPPTLSSLHDATVGPHRDEGPDAPTLGAGGLPAVGPSSPSAEVSTVAPTDVVPDADRLAPHHLDQIEHPVEVEIDQRRPAATGEIDQTGFRGGSTNVPSG